MTFWPLTNSDFPTDQTFHQLHDLYTELDLHRIMSGFHGAFATGVASQQGKLTLPDTWFRPPFWDFLMLQLLRPNFSNLPCLYSTFHLEHPLVLSRFCLQLLARSHGDLVCIGIENNLLTSASVCSLANCKLPECLHNSQQNTLYKMLCSLALQIYICIYEECIMLFFGTYLCKLMITGAMDITHELLLVRVRLCPHLFIL